MPSEAMIDSLWDQTRRMLQFSFPEDPSNSVTETDLCSPEDCWLLLGGLLMRNNSI